MFLRRRQCEAKHGRRHLDPIGSSIRHTQKLHLCKGTSHGRCYSQGGQNPSGMGMGCWEATTQGAERYHKGLTSSLSFVLRYMQCEAQQPRYRLYGDWVPQTRTCSKSQDSRNGDTLLILQGSSMSPQASHRMAVQSGA